MSVLFQRDWDGTNGEAWTTADFVAADVGSYPAEIQSNQGWGPGTGGTELLYVATAYPQSTNHYVDLDAVWDDAAGSGRRVGVLVRATTDGQDCYSFELDSNVGTTRARIRRRRAGTWADLTGWQSVGGAPSSAALNAGITIRAKVENTDEDTVSLTMLYGATELASYDDTHTNRIESGGTAGVLLDPNWVDDDIIVDALTVRDFEADWAGSGSLDEGVALVVDGTSYSWEDLQAAGILVGVPRQSYTVESVCTIQDTRALGAAETILYPGAVVTVSLDGTVVAFGRLRAASGPIDLAAGNTYEVSGPKELARDVLLVDPVWGGSGFRFNVPEDADDYLAARADLEVGEAISYIIDNHLEGDGNLRDQLAAPPDGAAYVQSELDAMDAVVPEPQVQGDPVSAVEQLLAYTKYALRIDPSSRQWRFYERFSGTIVQVDLADDHVRYEVREDSGRNYTRVLVRGSRPEATRTTLSTTSGLSAGWESGLEATHDASKQYKNTDTGLVDIVGASGGKLTMDPDQTGPPAFEMDAQEWQRGKVTFLDGDESGNTYTVFSNTGTRFTFDAGAWESGGPANGDSFRVEGNWAGGGRHNGHAEVGRRFLVTDTSKGILPGCDAQAVITVGNQQIRTGVTVRTPTDTGEEAELHLDLPAIGLINYLGAANPDPCTEGDADYLDVADVEIELPLFDRSTPSVPSKYWPTSGFYGTAYAKDSDKWSGGGKPGFGDPAVMRTYTLDLPGYDGSAAQDTEVEKFGQEILEVLSPLAREVRLVIAGIDTSWAGLGKRVQLVEAGGDTGDWATITDLDVQAVEWDPREGTTTVYAGTQGAWQYDIQRMRDVFLSRSRLKQQADLAQRLRELMACIKETPAGAGTIDALGPQAICASQVIATGGGSIESKIEAHEAFACALDEPGAPTEDCSQQCPAPTPVGNPAALSANAVALDGFAVRAWYPEGVATAAGEYFVDEALCCLAEHVRAQWAWQYKLGKALNDLAKVLNDEFLTFKGFIDTLLANDAALKVCINLLNTCMTNKQQAIGQPACWTEDPCPIVETISYSEVCGDYCATTAPEVACDAP